MKKIVCLLVVLWLLTGCSMEVYETIGNVVHVGQNQNHAGEILLNFPQEATVLTASGTDMLYQCDGYTLSLQQMVSGDLSATVRSLSGYDLSGLTVMETVCGNHKRYDWVWVAAGEQGDVLCRGAVIDDGNFHYSLCVSAEAENGGDLRDTWNELFGSFCLSETELN